MTCLLCEKNRVDGHYGLAAKTHCSGCCRTFGGGYHCSNCHRHFSGLNGFDLHLYRGVCRDIQSALLHKCGAPRFTLLDGIVTGTVHRAFGEGCRDWGKCA